MYLPYLRLENFVKEKEMMEWAGQAGLVTNQNLSKSIKVDLFKSSKSNVIYLFS
jgi:hypothetical protein